MIKDKKYELLKFGLTRPQVDAIYAYVYNDTMNSAVLIPAFVDLVAQGLVAIGDNTQLYTPQMGIALSAIFKDSIANGTDLDVAISELKNANASNTTIEILTGVAWYLDKVFPTVEGYFEGKNVTLDTLIEVHINISN